MPCAHITLLSMEILLNFKPPPFPSRRFWAWHNTPIERFVVCHSTTIATQSAARECLTPNTFWNNYFAEMVLVTMWVRCCNQSIHSSKIIFCLPSRFCTVNRLFQTGSPPIGYLFGTQEGRRFILIVECHYCPWAVFYYSSNPGPSGFTEWNSRLTDHRFTAQNQDWSKRMFQNGWAHSVNPF